MNDHPESVKRPLKEKVVLIYESLFRGEDLSRRNPNFWDELFLLSPHPAQIERIFSEMTGNQLLAIKPIVNALFARCIAQVQEEPSIRTVNALQTLCGIIQGVLTRTKLGFGFDMIDLLIGFDRAEAQMKTLIERLCEILVGDFHASLKSLCLKLMLTIALVSDNVSQNTLLEYLMINSVFETIISILASVSLRTSHGHEAVLLLTLLINYRKYENVNPYIVKLSILDDELALNGYSQVISGTLSAYNRKIQENLQSSEPTGLFSTLTNMVGNIFVPQDDSLDPVKTDESVLLAMYETVHLNRNFITTLTYLPTEADEDRSPENKKSEFLITYPSNLLVAFLTYCSVIMQDLRNERCQKAAKLCMIILTCIAEDQYANTLMHDINMTFPIPLYRAPMRHRKAGFDKQTPNRPLACGVLDLCMEFVLSHMMRQLPFELYLYSLGVIHRILCYEKKCRVRLKYTWRKLVNALASLLNFLIHNESHLITKFDIFFLAQKVVNILNVFITFGDSFLPNTATYDELYYEIIRHAEVFENLYSMTLRYTSSDGGHRNSALKLCSHLVNIRSIINHFTPKIETLSDGSVGTLSEMQILGVVRDNYDTLSLKLQENLDVYERYNEQPKESAFFINMVRLIIQESRGQLKNYAIDHKLIHKEFSLIK